MSRKQTRDRGITIILALFLGYLGIHRFYLGQRRGLWYLLFCWTLIPVVIAFIDFLMFLFMTDETFDRYYNQ